MWKIKKECTVLRLWLLPFNPNTKHECRSGNAFTLAQWRTQDFCSGGGGSTNSVDDRENGDLEGGSPLVGGSGGSSNFVQEISFHILKFS